ncbi:MAG TPA: hypothetical protein VGS22_27635 [Thermoanaerobaculia bacterium]|nr:hypothetical protein [Thermoanaerobaculia bacterium]
MAEGLRRKGADVFLWQVSDFPSQQTASLSLEEGAEKVAIDGLGLELEGPATAIWVRRPRPPRLPEGVVDPRDRDFAQRENNIFVGSLQMSVGREALWVNPPGSAGRANLRTEQLRTANAAGFAIPPTLCTNDPEEIRRFFRSYPNGVIYKSFFPAGWSNETGVAMLFTALVSEEDLPEGPLLRAVPGIFQARIDKAFELRVTAVGNELVAVKIRSQEIASSLLDWRAAAEDVPMEPFDLPRPIVAACREVMARLGIVYGAFDLIVTPENDYVFLEVNEMGAFLWLEERLPELGLLDTFCEFLRQGRIDFRMAEPCNRIRFDQVQAEVLRRVEEAALEHVSSPELTYRD